MLRFLVLLGSAWISLSGSLLADQTFQGNGFQFQYGDSEKVVVTGEKIKTVRVENANGSIFMIQNYGDSVAPEQLLASMTQSLLKKYPNNATEIRHKSVTRELFGKTQTGKYILFNTNNIPSESLLFTFKQDKDTICVITQMPLQYSIEAERMFATIQQSLSISTK